MDSETYKLFPKIISDKIDFYMTRYYRRNHRRDKSMKRVLRRINRLRRVIFYYSYTEIFTRNVLPEIKYIPLYNNNGQVMIYTKKTNNYGKNILDKENKINYIMDHNGIITNLSNVYHIYFVKKNIKIGSDNSISDNSILGEGTNQTLDILFAMGVCYCVYKVINDLIK